MYRPPKKEKRENSRSGEATLKESINELLEVYRLRGKFKETHVITAWERMMGAPIASRTHRIYIKDRRLYVSLTSAPLKHQLNMAKTKIVEMLNRDAGEQVIDEVVFL